MTVLRNWQYLPDDHLLTLDQCSEIAQCSKATLYKHRFAGLLPFVPGRPIQVRVADMRVYVAMIDDPKTRGRLHRSLTVETNDRASYSCLEAVPSFSAKAPRAIIEDVIAATEAIWHQYKRRDAAKKERQEGYERARRRRPRTVERRAVVGAD